MEVNPSKMMGSKVYRIDRRSHITGSKPHIIPAGVPTSALRRFELTVTIVAGIWTRRFLLPFCPVAFVMVMPLDGTTVYGVWELLGCCSCK